MVEILLPILRNAGPEYQLENAVTYLQNWDMDYSPGSTAASIYDLFLLKFSEKILTEEMGPELYHAFRELHHLPRSEEHTSELQSRGHLVCRLLLEKKNITNNESYTS